VAACEARAAHAPDHVKSVITFTGVVAPLNIVSMFIQFSNILTNPRPLQAGAVARDKLAPAFHCQTGTGASSADPTATACAFFREPATMATMQHGAVALPSVTTGPDQFWDELMTTSPLEDVLVARMAAANVGVGVSPPASCEVSAPLLAECASESFSVPPAATIEQRCVHLPVAKNDMKMQIVGQASALDPQIRHAPPQHNGQYKRAITSTTALRFLHIPADMHHQLGLDEMYSKQPAGRRDNVCTVHLVTGAIRAPVVMLRTTSRRQHHRRLSTGWREFCARAGVELGDELTFERAGTCNELDVHVVKAGLSKAICGR